MAATAAASLLLGSVAEAEGVERGATLVAETAAGGQPAQHPPADPARGMVYRGLERPARPEACPRHLYEVRDDQGALRGCTHGPDPAPQGVEVGDPVAVGELPRAARAPVPCVGDGTSGNRVQAIYGYPADGTDRYGSIAPLIQGWAASNVDDVFSASAAETGGTRHVRFVHDAACDVVVTKFEFSATGDDSFGNTISELRAAGFTSHERKYLVWMDAPGPYCGIGEVVPDDQPGADNLNNGHPDVDGLISRVDTPCWGLSTTPVETHELAHNMGAVQPSAPHSTSVWPWPAGWHCTDEYDAMCYDDDGAGPAQVVVLCPTATDRTLDCNHDDYFSTDPPPASYLDTHWNLADSSFLTDSEVAASHELTVSMAGDGSGTVTSSPPGVSCPGDCSETYANGDSVTLTSSPASGSVFAAWSGACSGSGSCVVSMTADRSATATFTLAPTTGISFAKKPAGLPFTVTWSDSGPAGFVFDVKYKIGTGTWKSWQTDVTALKRVFGKNGKPVTVKAGKKYSFKARWQYGSTKGPWSPKRSFKL